jgi:hypothetical protein
MEFAELPKNHTIRSKTPSSNSAFRSRYEWADVMLMPVNPNVVHIARAIEKALTDLGMSCGYLWSTLPEDASKHWGNTTDYVNWTKMILPVSWYANTPVYTIQMLRGLREVLRHDLRGKFGVFVTFIDGGWSPRLLSLACERQGIPTVLVQEGMTLQNKNVRAPRSLRAVAMGTVRSLRAVMAPQLFHSIEHGMHTQYACVYGPLKAASLIAKGKPQEQIFITGNPLFDSVTAKGINAQPRSRTILYAHEILNHDLDTEVMWWRALIKASQDIGVKLIFKLHPRSGLPAAQAREMLGNPDHALVHVVADGDIQDMIAQAGVFVTACSTSSYRALVEGVPIVVLEGVPARFRIDLPDYRAALSVHQPSELAHVLRVALDNAQVRLDLQKGVDVASERHLYRLDGQASHRVALALASLLR